MNNHKMFGQKLQLHKQEKKLTPLIFIVWTKKYRDIWDKKILLCSTEK